MSTMFSLGIVRECQLFISHLTKNTEDGKNQPCHPLATCIAYWLFSLKWRDFFLFPYFTSTSL